jgi:hypothetical protein
VAGFIGVDGLTFKLSPAKLSAGDPIVLMPSLSVSIDGKGVMAGTVTVIYPSINDPGYSPMPGTFNIRGSGDRVLVGGNPVILPGDSATTTIAFPGGPNGSVDVVAVTCEADDPNQESGEYLE